MSPINQFFDEKMIYFNYLFIFYDLFLFFMIYFAETSLWMHNFIFLMTATFTLSKRNC